MSQYYEEIYELNMSKDKTLKIFLLAIFSLKPKYYKTLKTLHFYELSLCYPENMMNVLIVNKQNISLEYNYGCKQLSIFSSVKVA